MKYFSSLLIAANLLLCSVMYGQIVPSFCNGPASLRAQYEVDAWYVAHDYLLAKDSLKWSKSVLIPSNVKDSVLHAILGVYNADLPARDTAIAMFNIHKFKQTDLRRFNLYMDTSHAWVRNFIQGDPNNTSNPYVDSLSRAYGFEVEDVNWLPEWVTQYDAIVRVKCNTYLNTDYLSSVMAGFAGVKYSYAYVFGGDGNHIFYEPKADYDEVTFRRGWGDCPAGCLFQRDWLFRVYHDDCSVEFVSSYGNPLDLSSSFAPKTDEPHLVTFPNPAQTELQVRISNLSDLKEVSIDVRDLMGRVMIHTTSPVFNGQVSTQLDFNNLLRGTYFVTIEGNNRPVVRKSVVKM